MPHTNDPENFAGRVNYAATCIVRGINSRKFYGCFEMNDGDAVVVALVRRAQKNPKLYEAIAQQWRGVFPQEWIEVADKYSSTKDLNDLARQLRKL